MVMYLFSIVHLYQDFISHQANCEHDNVSKYSQRIDSSKNIIGQRDRSPIVLASSIIPLTSAMRLYPGPDQRCPGQKVRSIVQGSFQPLPPDQTGHTLSHTVSPSPFSES